MSEVDRLVKELAEAIRREKEDSAGQEFAASLAAHMDAHKHVAAGMFEETEEETTTTEKARTFNEP